MPGWFRVFLFFGLQAYCVAAMPQPAPLTVIVNRLNPLDTVSREQLRALLMGAVKQWSTHQKVVIVQRDVDSDAYRKMLRQVLHMGEPEYRRALLEAEFRGESPPLVKTLHTNVAAGKFVANVPGALGVTDAPPDGPVAPQVKVLKIDGRLPSDPEYPLK